MGGRDFYGRAIRRGRIVRWYKREGERVDFGDDLYDLQVQELEAPRWQVEASRRFKEMRTQPNRIVELAGGPPREGDPPAVDSDHESMVAVSSSSPRRGGFVMRITSSDRGVLRRLYAGEGELRTAGDLLAVLSAEPGEPIDIADDRFQQASAFRVVENLLPWDEAPPIPAWADPPSETSRRGWLSRLRRRLGR